MVFLRFIPGAGHYLLGQRLKASIFGTLFVFLLLLVAFRWEAMLEAVQTTARKVAGERVIYTHREFDHFFATVFVAVAMIVLPVYSAVSVRRVQRRRAGLLPERPEGPWTIVWKQFRKNRLAITGALMILALYLVAILCPLLTPYDPTDQAFDLRLSPSWEHPLGTDGFGRDLLSRIIFGSRISLLVGFLSVGIAVTIGTLFGAVAGYFRGWIDSALMRFVDMMLAFPVLVLIITVLALWRSQSIWLIITVIGLTSWMGVARLIRGQFLSLREREFFLAARALGANGGRLIFRHLLPNALTPIIVFATLRVGNTILLEAGLSYLGLGVQPPTPSWGNIVYDTKGAIFSEWWMPLSAGLAVVVTVVSYNLLGDGLRDALDPRSRR